MSTIITSKSKETCEFEYEICGRCFSGLNKRQHEQCRDLYALLLVNKPKKVTIECCKKLPATGCYRCNLTTKIRTPLVSLLEDVFGEHRFVISDDDFFTQFIIDCNTEFNLLVEKRFMGNKLWAANLKILIDEVTYMVNIIYVD